MSNQKKRKYVSAQKISEKQSQGFSPDYIKTDIPMYKLKEGRNKFNVLPFEAGKGNPNADEGFWTYERSVWVHQNLGSDGKKKALCPAKFGKACPVCEYANKNKASLTKDEKSALYPKHRQLFLIQDLDAEDKAIKIFEGPHNFGFGELLKNKINTVDSDHPWNEFHSLENGFMCILSTKNSAFTNATGQGGQFIKPVNLEFEPRAKPLSEKLVAGIPSLDTILIEMDYKEIKKLFEAGIQGPIVDDDEDEDEDETDKEEDEDDDEEEEENEEEEVKEDKKKKVEKKSSKKDDEEDEEEEDDEEEEEEEDDEEEEEDDDDDDESEDEEEEEDDDDDDESEDEEEEEEDDDDDDESEDEEEKSSKKKKEVTAKERGIAVGDKVKHKKYGECSVIHISGDGTSLRLKDSKGAIHKDGIGPDEVEKLKTAKEKVKASKKATKDDDDDDVL